jgi:hypothetical protein
MQNKFSTIEIDKKNILKNKIMIYISKYFLIFNFQEQILVEFVFYYEKD